MANKNVKLALIFDFWNEMSKRSERNDLRNIEQVSLPSMPIMWLGWNLSGKDCHGKCKRRN